MMDKMNCRGEWNIGRLRAYLHRHGLIPNIKIFHFVPLILLLIQIVSCNLSQSTVEVTHPSTATNETPKAEPTSSAPIEPPLPTRVAISPTAEVLYNGSLLLETDGVIWSISFPSQEARTILQDEKYIFGMPMWSLDGEHFAYARATIGCPYTGTIWLSKSDGTESFQVGSTIEGYYDQKTASCDGGWLYPAFPDTWSDDRTLLSVVLNGNRIYSMETNELLQISPLEVLEEKGFDAQTVNETLLWRNFSKSSNRGLLMGEAMFDEDVAPVWLWVMFDDLDTGKILEIPSNVSLQPNGIGYTTAWSPNSKFLAVATLSENESQLWRVHVNDNSWELVKTWPIEDSIDRLRFVAWSADSHWLSWYSRDFDSRTGKFDSQALILDTHNWEVSRTVSLIEIEAADFPTWIKTATGELRLVQWMREQDGGIFLLHPSDSTRDQLLISFEELAEMIPNIQHASSPRAWQP